MIQIPLLFKQQFKWYKYMTYQFMIFSENHAKHT